MNPLEDPGIKNLEWFHNPTKRNVFQAIQGQYPDVQCKKTPGKGQMNGFDQIGLVNGQTNEIIHTIYVSCSVCNTLFTANGGQLVRHRKTCHFPFEIQSQELLAPTTKSDVSRVLGEMLSDGSIPAYRLEIESFRKGVEQLLVLGKRMPNGQDPALLIPSRNNVRQRMMETLDENMLQLRAFVLPAAKQNVLCLLADFGKIKRDFLSIRASYIMEVVNENGRMEWKTIVVPLSFRSVPKDPKTTERIVEYIDKAVQDVLGERLDLLRIPLVADGATNFRRCGKIHFLDYMRCMAHATDVAANRCLRPYKNFPATTDEIEVLEKYKAILKNCSQFSADVLSDKELYDSLNCPLKTPCDTRWFSEFDTAEAVYKSIDILIGHLDQYSAKAHDALTLLMSLENRQLFRELTLVISPLASANDYYQKNSDTMKDTVSVFLTILDEFEQMELTCSTDGDVLLKFGRYAVVKMFMQLNELHYAAAFLNPPTKKMCHLQSRINHHSIPVNCVVMAEECIKRLDKHLTPQQTPPTTPIAPRTAPSPQIGRQDFIRDKLKRVFAHQDVSLDDEQAVYMADNRSMEASDFWPLMKGVLPRLYRVAMKVHGIQSSQADVERSFSQAKYLFSPNRRSLDLVMMEKMLIRKEMDKYSK